MMRLALMTMILTALSAPGSALRECRHPNYVARDSKIYAIDPEDSAIETEIKIKGVTWSGFERENMIPEGLWGQDSNNAQGTQGTTIAKVMDFLESNDFNSVRVPLKAAYVVADATPQLSYIHQYDNQELTTWENSNDVTYLDLIGRFIQTLQDKHVSVLLDMHLLTLYNKDALWYTAPYKKVNETVIYDAVSVLAKTMCKAGLWNILGISMKNAMLDAQWVGNDNESDPKTDWHDAAEILTERVLELCPQWLVFVEGASSPTQYENFQVNDDYPKQSSKHWNGGNLHNATERPLDVSAKNKVVYAPQAHAHNVDPRNYFYKVDRNCSTSADDLSLTEDQLETECVDFVDGKKVESKIDCSDSMFYCESYEHLTVKEIATNYASVMEEALGDLVSVESTIPVVLGSFSGVYEDEQPHQKAALDYLIDYAASIQGGYFWALNPDTEYYLEGAQDGKAGAFGRTHYGLMSVASWQKANADLLKALGKMSSSKIPCYGGVEDEDNGSGRIASTQMQTTLTVAIAMSFWTVGWR